MVVGRVPCFWVVALIDYSFVISESPESILQKMVARIFLSNMVLLPDVGLACVALTAVSVQHNWIAFELSAQIKSVALGFNFFSSQQVRLDFLFDLGAQELEHLRLDISYSQRFLWALTRNGSRVPTFRGFWCHTEVLSANPSDPETYFHSVWKGHKMSLLSRNPCLILSTLNRSPSPVSSGRQIYGSFPTSETYLRPKGKLKVLPSSWTRAHSLSAQDRSTGSSSCWSVRCLWPTEASTLHFLPATLTRLRCQLIYCASSHPNPPFWGSEAPWSSWHNLFCGKTLETFLFGFFSFPFKIWIQIQTVYRPAT